MSKDSNSAGENRQNVKKILPREIAFLFYHTFSCTQHRWIGIAESTITMDHTFQSFQIITKHLQANPFGNMHIDRNRIRQIPQRNITLKHFRSSDYK